MKKAIISTTAILSLFALTLPGVASATTLNWQPPAIQQAAYQQAGYQQVGFFRGRPLACSNRYFRRHHRWECR